MKKIYGFAFASALMMLASCSNDNEPVNNGPVNPDETGSTYLRVNVVNAGGTRTEDGYENGTGNENTITKLHFVVLQNNTVVYVKPVDTDTDDWTGPADFPNTVEMIGGTTLIIPNSALGSTNNGATAVPTDLDLLVLCNYPDTDIVAQSTTKSDLESKMLSIAADQTSFVMSNSAYFATNATDADVVREVRIDHKYLVNTEQAALDMPMDVYVERLAARADLTATDLTYDKNTIVYENKKGDDRVITPEIVGFAYFQDPGKTNLLKNTTNWDSSWFNGGVNNANFHRSFWATTPDYTDAGFTFTTETAAWDKTTKKEYINENTLGGNKATKVVVMAILKDQDKNVMDMANVFGQFTTKDGAGVLIANTLKGLGYWVVSADGKIARTIEYGKELNYSGKALAGSDKVGTTTDGKDIFGNTFAVGEGKGNCTYLEVSTLKDGEYYGTIASVNPETQEITWNTIDRKTINDLLKGDDYAVSYWNGGRTYFYTDIQHLIFGTDGTLNPGVVRNHIYKINFTEMYGLGTPVFDPDMKLIPTPPTYDDDNKVNLAATINVLNWRVVNNDNVVLGPKPAPAE
ncbi:MAG: Mfa1 family fimbria major subunit [Muribaculaceae bacterium]|nr:Mfa1 family fimbria major subunit [Muribaculaceae bacterium]